MEVLLYLAIGYIFRQMVLFVEKSISSCTFMAIHEKLLLLILVNLYQDESKLER